VRVNKIEKGLRSDKAHKEQKESVMYQTNMYEGMFAETITITGDDNQLINAYFARPLGAGPFPGMVLVHHMPGWDEWYREATRKFAHQGYAAISPNLYFRAGHGMLPPKFVEMGVFPMIMPWVTSEDRCCTFVHCPISTAWWACLERVPEADMHI
jgi:hypothetical protein